MKHFILCFIVSSFQIFSQSYLNILLSNDSYKNSPISEVKKITLSENGEVIYFYLSDLSVASENISDVKRFIFSDTQLGSLLPVELSAFNASQVGSSVFLKWRTETEINNFGFDVERCALSAERQAWEKIGFVEGNGNSNSPKDYSFTDNPSIGSKYYYRLKQIDSDGRFEYSDIITIDIKLPDQYMLLQNYPNPFNPGTVISYQLPINSAVTLKIYDILGNEIKVLVNEFKSAGMHNVEFDAGGLSSGVYIYRIQAGPFDQNKKMIVLK